MSEDYLLEQVKTIKNLCEIAILLRQMGKNELLPTVLELVFGEAQQMNDDYCVVRNAVP